MLKKLVLIVVIIGIGLGTAVAAIAQEPRASRDLSQDRSLGIGLQAPCAFSFRFWLTESLGLEANAFLISTGDFTIGCLAAKTLLRLANTDIFDFYAVLWANLHLGDYAQPSIADVAILGGMELSILPSLAINLEFGQAIFFEPTRVGFQPTFSLGLHYYFLKPVRVEPPLE
ncbi:hypothetical protein LM602_01485 [Candidatus Acetothermia bacterium]|jgi:hypothetical protein|nr:hypothetical protein [Candidatus Acetothermia bacterium]MCI2431216.1 hypothetical protein [Candidatus Acetothermia bacterium]MCI2436829.1 hypothetical protein [Candidatus Acetothermia bacterium]